MNAKKALSGAVWRNVEVDSAKLEHLTSHLGDPLLARALLLVGVSDTKQAESFLSPKFEDLHAPELMKDMDKTIARLRRAIDAGESVRVVTDYDVDGTTSSLILQSLLEIHGHKNFSYHIPHRMKEGYGFSLFAAEQAAEDGVDLIVTADIGVRDVEAITYAQSRGIDVLVLDHHLPEGCGVPQDAYAVLCPPQADCHYPNPALAACGISLKLAQAMLRGHAREHELLMSLLKLAALGTVADVVSLSNAENRAIVHYGLKSLNESRHSPGLQALLDYSKATVGQIDEETIGYRIGPRINAAGRLASANSVVELLRCRDPHMARLQAENINDLNAERQALQQTMVDRATAALGDGEQPAFVSLAFEESEEWHRGVIGVVAGRLRDALHRPVALGSIMGDTVRGSVRSIPAVHATEALASASELLQRYGGHAAAAGFTLPLSHWDALSAALVKAALDQQDGNKTEKSFDIGLEVGLGELNANFWERLSRLSPFGKDNPEPTLCIRGVKLKNMRLLQAKHVTGEFEGGSPNLSWIWFYGGEHYHALSAQSVDLLGYLKPNRYRGRHHFQLHVLDARTN